MTYCTDRLVSQLHYKIPLNSSLYYPFTRTTHQDKKTNLQTAQTIAQIVNTTKRQNVKSHVNLSNKATTLLPAHHYCHPLNCCSSLRQTLEWRLMPTYTCAPLPLDGTQVS